MSFLISFQKSLRFKEGEVFLMKIALSLAEMSLGGAPKFTLNLGQYLAGAGHNVTITTERQGEWWPELAACGLTGHCLPPPQPGASFVRQARQLANYWNSRNFDVIIVNVSGLNRLAQCALHLVVDRTAVVLILHGEWNSLYTLAARNIAAWNCAVGVSPKVYEGAAARFPQKPIFCIHNGIELPSAVQLQARLNWELPLRLLFVGRLIDAHKGVFRLPAILSMCRKHNLPVQLTVIGDGEDSDRLAQLFVEAGVNNLVNMTGAQPPTSISAAMQRHHLFIFPTNTEGMPLVVLEAQASGCVVIATALPGITDVAIEDQITGRLVEPGDIKQFAAHIAAMMKPTVWQSHSHAAIERAQRMFSLSVMGDQYLELLEALTRGTCPLERPYNRARSCNTVPFTPLDYLPLLLFQYMPSSLLHRLGQVKHKLRRIVGVHIGKS